MKGWFGLCHYSLNPEVFPLPKRRIQKAYKAVIFKPRSHTMKSLKALQSLQEKRSLPFCSNVFEAFQCGVTYIMK